MQPPALSYGRDFPSNVLSSSQHIKAGLRTHKLHFLSSCMCVCVSSSLSASPFQRKTSWKFPFERESVKQMQAWISFLPLCALPGRGKCGMHERGRETDIKWSVLASALPSLLNAESSPVLWSSLGYRRQALIAESWHEAERELHQLTTNFIILKPNVAKVERIIWRAGKLDDFLLCRDIL